MAWKGYPLTFFHQLRVIDYNTLRNLEGSGKRFIDELFANSVPVGDAGSFKKRFELFASSLTVGSRVRVVVHTKYGVPFWCSEGSKKPI